MKNTLLIASLVLAFSPCASYAGGKVDLQILGKEDSLLPLRQVIENSNLSPNEIALGFDLDGTLTNLAPPALKKTANERLRGGQESRDFFNYLQERGIPWFINSARAATESSMKGVATSYYNLELPTPQGVPIEQDCFKGKNGTSYNFSPTAQNSSLHLHDKTYSTIDCNHIISVVEDGSDYAFDKDISFEYSILKNFKSYPKLIVFVDDNAKNVMTVYNHYKEYAAQHGDADFHFVGVLYDPQRKESDHDQYKAIMDQEIERLYKNCEFETKGIQIEPRVDVNSILKPLQESQSNR